MSAASDDPVDRVSPADGAKQAPPATDGERHLKRLCEHSFLKFWSYSRIFQDSALNAMKIGKELCDLIVIFGNDIVLFSDKHCEFPAHCSVEVAWQRWYRRAVRDGEGQLFGAERRVREFPDRLFLDPQCLHRIPIQIPKHARFHRIVVARGIGDACKRHFGGGSGSLMLRSDVSGASMPFVLGTDRKRGQFVHVLDDTTLDIILGTLDTAPDLINYLNAKEVLFTSSMPIVASGEEELLAYYLMSGDDLRDRKFAFRDSQAVVLNEGHWERLLRSSRRAAQLRANSNSYDWDAMINRMADQVSRASYPFGERPELNEAELALREMASENRTTRRLLANHIAYLIDKSAKSTGCAIGLIMPAYSGSAYYALFGEHCNWDANSQEAQLRRRLSAREYMIACKAAYPSIDRIVGIYIATFDGMIEEAVTYLTFESWTTEDQAMADRIRTERGFLKNIYVNHLKVVDYPPEIS